MNKKVLILGGTMFVGRILVEKLRGLPQYDVTLFNRGKSNTGLFADVKQLHGNRETDDIQQVYNQHWDCVIDFSGYYPVTFEKLLGNLKGNVGRYIFISTISVFGLEKFEGRAVTETDEILGCTDAQKTSKLPDAYGEKKAEMERILLQQTWLDKIILRPSFIYGRYDWTERLYYWLYRAKFNNQILIPDDFSIALTYAEDLAQAILHAIETPVHQVVYNTISETSIPVKQVVNETAALLGRQVAFVAATPALMDKHGLNPAQFPLYVPFKFSVAGSQWLSDFNVAHTGLKKSLEQTIAYHDSQNWKSPATGLTTEKEKEVLGN